MKKSTKRKIKRIKSKIKNRILTTIFITMACLFIFSACAGDTEGTQIFKIIMIVTMILLVLFGYANRNYVLKED